MKVPQNENMSKIGEKVIQIQPGVEVDIIHDLVKVKGKEGGLEFKIPRELQVVRGSEGVKVKRLNEGKRAKSLHGLYRTILSNAIKGIENPWEKRLEVVGTGYNVKLQGEDLVFKIGYSHPLTFKKIPGIRFELEGNNKVIVKGMDKQLVGQVAYQIKSMRMPDAYKGKGIRYEGEKLRIKPGKKAKTVTSAGAGA